MFSIVKKEGVRFTLTREILPLGASIAIAEAFYKFHSFTLECFAFLGTWFALSALWNEVYARVAKPG